MRCLEENCDKSFTIDEIVDLLKSRNEFVGRSTIYRYIENLCQSGQVRRFVQEGRKSATYQYMENHEQCENHMHLKCLTCGKIVHLGCDFMSEVCGHISKYHKFEVDNSKTVILGLCADCLEKEKNHAGH